MLHIQLAIGRQTRALGSPVVSLSSSCWEPHTLQDLWALVDPWDSFSLFFFLFLQWQDSLQKRVQQAGMSLHPSSGFHCRTQHETGGV